MIFILINTTNTIIALGQCTFIWWPRVWVASSHPQLETCYYYCVQCNFNSESFEYPTLMFLPWDQCRWTMNPCNFYYSWSIKTKQDQMGIKNSTCIISNYLLLILIIWLVWLVWRKKICSYIYTNFNFQIFILSDIFKCVWMEK